MYIENIIFFTRKTLRRQHAKHLEVCFFMFCSELTPSPSHQMPCSDFFCSVTGSFSKQTLWRSTQRTHLHTHTPSHTPQPASISQHTWRKAPDFCALLQRRLPSKPLDVRLFCCMNRNVQFWRQPLLLFSATKSSPARVGFFPQTCLLNVICCSTPPTNSMSAGKLLRPLEPSGGFFVLVVVFA